MFDDSTGQAVLSDYDALPSDSAAPSLVAMHHKHPAVYRSPECQGGDTVTPGTEVYGLACTLVHAAIGNPPLEAEGLLETTIRMMTGADKVGALVVGWNCARGLSLGGYQTLQFDAMSAPLAQTPRPNLPKSQPTNLLPGVGAAFTTLLHQMMVTNPAERIDLESVIGALTHIKVIKRFASCGSMIPIP